MPAPVCTEVLVGCVTDYCPTWVVGLLVLHDAEGNYLGKIDLSRDGGVVTDLQGPPSSSASPLSEGA
jgi:hypothetical protein